MTARAHTQRNKESRFDLVFAVTKMYQCDSFVSDFLCGVFYPVTWRVGLRSFPTACQKRR